MQRAATTSTKPTPRVVRPKPRWGVVSVITEPEFQPPAKITRGYLRSRRGARPPVIVNPKEERSHAHASARRRVRCWRCPPQSPPPRRHLCSATTPGLTSFTVPTTGTYDILASGAGGADSLLFRAVWVPKSRTRSTSRLARYYRSRWAIVRIDRDFGLGPKLFLRDHRTLITTPEGLAGLEQLRPSVAQL